MGAIKVGDRVRLKDRPDWPGSYRLANSEGTVFEVQEESGYVLIHIEKSGVPVDLGSTLTLREEMVEKCV